MKTLTCPNCQNEMDFMAFLKSTTPWHLKCVHCQTKLRLKKYELEAFLIAVTVGVLTLTILSHFQTSSLTYAVLLTAIVTGFEYILYHAMKKLGVGLELR